MKRILIIVISIIIFGCSQKLDNPKYKIGDIVYLKPDSAKVVIVDDDVSGGNYEITYSQADFFRHYCNEEDIYGK